MRHYSRRCEHCKSVYAYQASGNGCFHPDNDNRFCNDCMHVINSALNDVEPKFEDTWIETDEVTFDQLKQWEIDKITEYKAKIESGQALFPPSKRIFAGSHNMQTGERDITELIEGRDSFKNREFIYSYFSSRPNIVRITTRVEKNLETGKTKPWVTYN